MSYWRFLLSSRPDRQWQFVDGDVRVGDARIVDKNIEALKFKAHGAEEPVDGPRIATIAGMSDLNLW